MMWQGSSSETAEVRGTIRLVLSKIADHRRFA